MQQRPNTTTTANVVTSVKNNNTAPNISRNITHHGISTSTVITTVYPTIPVGPSKTSGYG